MTYEYNGISFLYSFSFVISLPLTSSLTLFSAFVCCSLLIFILEIDHVVIDSGDAGAFYIGRDWTSQGQILRYNYVHGIKKNKKRREREGEGGRR